MKLESTFIFLLIYWTRGAECSHYNRNGQLYLQQQQQQQQYPLPAQRYRQQVIKNRFHPTTYSKESSEEVQTAAANMPKPQTLPQIQYAYQGGDAPQEPPDYPDLDVHQGEVLNHVRQPGPQSAITPRPHPVYQQMAKPSGGSSVPEPPQQPPPSQGIQQQVISSPIYRPQGIDYDPHQGYPDHHYPEHLEFDGYHYSYPIHHHPPPPPPPKRPPPQKSKATESQYAYYYIGRHLWYIPLYFSIYFIAYVGLLVLKSIARHKVLLPHLSEEAAMQRQHRENHVLRSIARGEEKYYMRR